MNKNILHHLSLSLYCILAMVTLVDTLYTTNPITIFKAVQPTSLFFVPVIKLSPTGEKIAISYLNTTSLTLLYKIVTLSGVQQCKRQHTNQTRFLIAWPKNYGLMFLANDNLTVNYFTQQCDMMQKLVKFQKKPYKVVTTFRQPNDSIVTFAYQNTQNINLVLEYFMKDKYEYGRYYGWVDDTIKTISYSDDSKILFISGNFSNSTVNYTWQQIKIKSNLKNLQINTTVVPKKVTNNNYQCIGLINNDTYVKMDENNNTKIIRIFLLYRKDTLQANEKQGGICTKDDVLVTLRFINLVQKIDILIYSTKDGSLLQTIPLDFIPVPMAQPLGGTKFIQCDSDSLVLLGGDGIVRVYQYKYGTIMAVWIIVLISIIGVIVIFSIGCCVYNKRKKLQRRDQVVSQYSNLIN